MTYNSSNGVRRIGCLKCDLFLASCRSKQTFQPPNVPSQQQQVRQCPHQTYVRSATNNTATTTRSRRALFSFRYNGTTTLSSSKSSSTSSSSSSRWKFALSSMRTTGRNEDNSWSRCHETIRMTNVAAATAAVVTGSYYCNESSLEQQQQQTQQTQLPRQYNQIQLPQQLQKLQQTQQAQQQHPRQEQLQMLDRLKDEFTWLPNRYSLQKLWISHHSATTSCDSAGISDEKTSIDSTKRFGSNYLRRHRTVQMIQSSSVKQRTLESKYKVQWEKPLGEGSFGTVYLGVDTVTGEQFAVKKIAKQFTDNASFQREMDALLHLRNHAGHPHICGLHENYDEGGYYYLVLDLIQGGEMFDHLCANGAYSEFDAARLIREVANALAFLHGIGIVHGDLKPENLMLSSQNASDAVIKVVDFGCAQTTREDEKGNINDGTASDTSGSNAANTPAYCPPEVLKWKAQKIKLHQRQNESTKSSFTNPFQLFKQHFELETTVSVEDEQALSTLKLEPSFDMWALGIIIYIMLTGVHPFDLYGNASDKEIEHKILSRHRPPLRNSPLTAHLSKDAIDVIDQLLQWDPTKRISAHELLQNPWVRGETALTQKIADSDKRLSAFRAFKTKLEALVFAEMALFTSRTDDDNTSLDLVSKSNSSNISNSTAISVEEDEARLDGNVDLKSQLQDKGTDAVAKRTSIIEMAFRSFDPHNKGYVTTADLQNRARENEQNSETNTANKDVLSSSSSSSIESSAVHQKHDNESLCLSGFSDLLAENMKNRYFPKGHIVYNEGDVGNCMYFINSGSIEVFTRDGVSRTLRRPGDFFGEGALLHPKRLRSASIRCVTPVHAIEISREYFEKYLASDSTVKLNVREKDKSRKRQRAKTLLRVQQSLQQRKYKKGEYLFREGEDGQELFILEDGKVDVTLRKHKVFGVQPGEMCGEHSLILGKPRNTTAQCTSDNGCNVHVLRAKDFYIFLDSYPSMKESIHDICLRREFQKAMCIATKQSFPRNEDDLRKAFDKVDVKKLGYLDLDSISKMMKNIDPNYDQENLKDTLKSLDLVESGRVTWDAFKRIFGIDDERA